MAEFKKMLHCDLCGSEYQFGPHIYNGKYIARYKLAVCMPCYEGNWDGWAPHYEENILKHLKSKELPIPERNSNGWLPRD